MELENKYTTVTYKTHTELNEKLKKFNSEGWEVISVFNNDNNVSEINKSAEVLLKKTTQIKESGDNKQILND
jgi:hypothetical protein